MFTLFAYTKDPAQRVVRFQLDNVVQVEMDLLFRQQLAAFDASCEETIEFDGKYKPDAGEVLCIPNFELIDDLPGAVQMPLGIQVAAPGLFSFESIRSLFVGELDEQGEPVLCFQHFDKRRIISGNGFSIFHSQETYRKIEGAGLTLDTKLSAVLRGQKLCFHNFFFTQQMFDMSSYYKDATDADIHEFVELPQVSVADVNQLLAVSDNWVRRKLWLIRQSQILEKVPMNDIKTIATEFQVELEFIEVDGAMQIALPTDKKKLKNALRFLDEDYYKSPLSQTNYITNSKRAIKQSATTVQP